MEANTVILDRATYDKSVKDLEDYNKVKRDFIKNSKKYSVCYGWYSDVTIYSTSELVKNLSDEAKIINDENGSLKESTFNLERKLDKCNAELQSISAMTSRQFRRWRKEYLTYKNPDK